MLVTARNYDTVEIGERFEYAMTMTESHLVLGAGLFGDFNPLHVNAQFAASSRFGGRIVHGYLTSSFMAAALGMLFHGSATAYLEHTCRFLAPVRIGDTLTAEWRIAAKQDKPAHGGGIVDFEGRCLNQDGMEVAVATGKMLIQSGSGGDAR